MAPRFEHRCVSCGTLVGSTQRSRTSIGAPFAACPRCGGFVERAPFQEWALLGGPARLRLLGGGALLAACTGVLPALAYAVLGMLSSAPPPRATVVALALVGWLVATGAWSFGLLRRVQRSQRRMADPMYRAELAKFQLAAAAAPRD